MLFYRLHQSDLPRSSCWLRYFPPSLHNWYVKRITLCVLPFSTTACLSCFDNGPLCPSFSMVVHQTPRSVHYVSITSHGFNPLIEIKFSHGESASSDHLFKDFTLRGCLHDVRSWSTILAIKLNLLRLAGIRFLPWLPYVRFSPVFRLHLLLIKVDRRWSISFWLTQAIKAIE